MAKDFSPVVITLVVAAFASFIQYRQWKTAKEKLRLDLFDRRLEYFLEVKRIIENFIFSDMDKNYISISNDFVIITRKSKFLFGDDLVKYIEGLHRQISELHSDILQLKTLESGEKREEVSKKVTEKAEALDSAFKEVDSVFLPYLDFRNVRVR